MVNCNKLQTMILYLSLFYNALSCFCLKVENRGTVLYNSLEVTCSAVMATWYPLCRIQQMSWFQSVSGCSPDRSPPSAYYHSYVVPPPSTTITKLTHSLRQLIPADPLVFTIWQEWFRNCGGPVVPRPFPAAVTCPGRSKFSKMATVWVFTRLPFKRR